MTSFLVNQRFALSRQPMVAMRTILTPMLMLMGVAVHSTAAVNNPPSFKPVDTPLFVLESTPIGSTITQLAAVDTDSVNLTFAIVGDASVVTGAPLLRIQQLSQTTAAVVLNRQLNAMVQTRYVVIYTVTDRVNPPISTQAGLFVTSNVNHPPFFVNLPYTATVYDNFTVGSIICSVSANDIDSGLWGSLSYRFQVPQNKFSIDINAGSITLNSPLDYADSRFYSLGVIVTDGVGLNDSATVEINVKSSLGQTPVFFKMPYTGSVYENTSVGSSICRVVAESIGDGPPIALTYSLYSGGLGMFDIDQQSGWIYVNSTIRWYDTQVVQKNGILPIIVQVNQSAPNPLGNYQSAQALVTVSLIYNVNQLPRFNQQVVSATVCDCSLVGTVVLLNTTITLTNIDQGDGGKFTVSLQKDGASFDALQVSPSVGEKFAILLVTVRNATFIAQYRGQSFTFEILARRYLTPAISSSVRIQMTIVAADDSSPTFGQSFYSTTINCRSQSGTKVIDITINNAGNFDMIRYSLKGPSAQMFYMNPVTGSVFLNSYDPGQLKAYSRQSVYLLVVANDNRNRTGAALLAIAVHAGPSFVKTQQYFGYLAENSLEFIVPITVQAVDYDFPPNNTFYYALVNSNWSRNFKIDPTTGQISILAPLDFETLPASLKGQLNLTVAVVDYSDQSLNDTTYVIIIVQDVNDCAPVFTQVLYAATIYTSSTTGTHVTSVSAVDCDATSPNNMVSYFIVGGSRDNFDIDNRTGVIAVSSSAVLDPTVYHVTVLAIDRGSTQLTGQTQVDVSVLGVGLPPRITTSGDLLLASVAEDVVINKVFFNVSAVNPTGNSRLQYSLLNGSALGYDVRGQPVYATSYLTNLLSIDQRLGSVAVQKTLNRDLVQQVRVVVVASDTVTLLSATATLMVTIVAPMSESPVFLPVTGAPSMIPPVSAASHRVGDVVARVVAVDPEFVKSSVSYFVVHDSDWSRAFDVTDTNRYSGIVTLTGTPYHHAGQGSLTVVAVSSRQPATNASTLLSIQVVDSNVTVNSVQDSGLSWNNSNWVVSVAENATVGTVVTMLSADCKCKADNCSLSYYVIAGDPLNKFRLDPNSGILSTAGLLNRESLGSFYLEVIARSSADTVVGRVLVSIADVNDNAPVFDSLLYTSSVSKDAPVGIPVFIVEATDADIGINSVITYTIDYNSGTGSRSFVIDPISGQISVVRSLLSFNGDIYFNVRAVDRGQPPLSALTSVHLTVNSNQWQIVSPPDNVTILADANTARGDFVAQVKAVLSSNPIGYELLASSVDYASFSIDTYSGIITALTTLNQHPAYSVTVGAHSLAKPSSLTSRNISIKVRNATIPRPLFNAFPFVSPFSIYVVEGRTGVRLTTLNAPRVAYDVCYYIIGGSAVSLNSFSLDKTTGVLMLTSPLDTSRAPILTLVVKATDDCWSGYWEMPSNRNLTWDAGDLSEMLVQVYVLRKTQLTSSTLFAAVSREAQLGSPVVQLTDYLLLQNPSPVLFSIQEPFSVSQSPMRKDLSLLKVEPFSVGSTDGVIRTNVYFQSTWSGYFMTDVYVADENSISTGSKASITIYILEDYQRVILVCQGTPDVVGSRRTNMVDLISSVVSSSLTAGIDVVEQHGSDTNLTDVFVHAINATIGQVWNATELKAVLLASKDFLRNGSIQEVLTMDEVTAARALESKTSQSSSSSSLEKSLIIALAVIGALLLVVIAIAAAVFCVFRRRYELKEKAADAMTATITHTASHGQNQVEIVPAIGKPLAGISPDWPDLAGRTQYQQFSDATDTTSSGNSSASPQSSTKASASTIALDNSPDDSKSRPPTGDRSSATPSQWNGLPPRRVQRDPTTGIYVYQRELESRWKPAVGNGHNPVLASGAVESTPSNFHSTIV